MPIYCLGLNHNTADISLRDRVAFSDEDIETFLTSHTNSQSEASWDEMIVLSTCNRVEIYCVSATLTVDVLEKQIASIKGLTVDEIHSNVYQFVDEQVVSHLFRVASGLDSMVLGESQILGQVTDAYQTALEFKATGKTLSKLFQSAIQTGKRVRSETTIGENSTSVPSVAAKLITKKIKDTSKAKIVLLGAGEMAELAVESLRKRGIQDFHILSRTLSSACKLAERWQGEANTIEALPQALQEADVLITSTSAPHIILDASFLSDVLKTRKSQRPLIIIDIAVPRDVDPLVSELPNVFLYDIDTLNSEVSRSLNFRKTEVPKAEKIIIEEYALFIEYLAVEKVIPVIRSMRKKANQIRQAELKKAVRRIPELSPATYQQIDKLTESIMNKILHSPTARLRAEATGAEVGTFTEITQALFGLEETNSTNGMDN